MQSAFTPAPKSSPPAGMPPTSPGSAVRVICDRMFSSAATDATPSGMPMPRFTTPFSGSSNAARRAMILRGLKAMRGSDSSGTLSSPENAGL